MISVISDTIYQYITQKYHEHQRILTNWPDAVIILSVLSHVCNEFQDSLEQYLDIFKCVSISSSLKQSEAGYIDTRGYVCGHKWLIVCRLYDERALQSAHIQQQSDWII